MFKFLKYLTIGKKIKLAFYFILLFGCVSFLSNNIFLGLLITLFAIIVIGNLSTAARKDEIKKEMLFKEDVENEYFEEKNKRL